MSEIRAGDITIDTNTMTVKRGGSVSYPTRRQYDLLVYLAKADGRPVSREELVREVFGGSVHLNTVEVCIKSIREYLGESSITTRHGFGYLIGGGRG